MEKFFELLESQGGQGDQLGIWEVALALSLCQLCMLMVSLVYRFTHKGPNYSQSYVQSLSLMGMVTTVIMIVIGSNIARAFSLVGALSIIRFRNAVKETRDVGYIFFAMAIAMACGTRFYLVAILATNGISAVMVLLYLLDFGSSRRLPERLLTVQLPAESDAETVLNPVLDVLFESYAIVSVESVRQGMYIEVVLSVRPKPHTTGSGVLEAISKVNDNLKVSYNYNTETDDA